MTQVEKEKVDKKIIVPFLLPDGCGSRGFFGLFLLSYLNNHRRHRSCCLLLACATTPPTRRKRRQRIRNFFAVCALCVMLRSVHVVVMRGIGGARKEKRDVANAFTKHVAKKIKQIIKGPTVHLN